MFQAQDQSLITIAEARQEKMVSPTGGIPTLRLARFLKPSIMSLHEAPLLSNPQAHTSKKSPPTLHFKGWRSPQKIWKQWVDDLKPRFGDAWKKIGIYDSIIMSTCEFRKDDNLILGLAEVWCPETNTFVFPWGEATITLEDMLIIGGVPIIGEPLTSPLTGELVEIEKMMIQHYKQILRSSAQRVGHCGWIQRFMGLDGKLEHAAFLTLWLSRYIFPSKPENKILVHTFPVAIHLSQATPIALAPAVLATIYKDLRILKEQIVDSSDDLLVTVWAPFQVVQLWAWERFPSLQPNPKYLIPGEPRAARWHSLPSKSKLKLVKSTLSSADDFCWRPYSCILDNWRHPLYAKEHGEWVVITPNIDDEELLSFSRCFVPCELVGFDCNEQYHPHRVGMQFGMDQDIPGPFTCINANFIIVRGTFRKIICYIPPRLFESDVTAKYFEWWNQSNTIKDNKPKSVSVQQTSSSSSRESLKSSESETSLSLPPPIAVKQLGDDQNSSDEDKMSISEWSKRRHDYVLANDKTASSSKSLLSSKVVGSSSTPDKKDTKKHLTISSDNAVYNKASTKSENSSQAEKDVMSNICSKSYYHGGTNTHDDELSFPGSELEDRIEKLEAIVNLIKMERRRVLGKTKTKASYV